jgi:hypothetical protein
MGRRYERGRFVYRSLDGAICGECAWHLLHAEIVAWILPAAVGVPLIVRAHTGARAERPMRGPL